MDGGGFNAEQAAFLLAKIMAQHGGYHRKGEITPGNIRLPEQRHLQGFLPGAILQVGQGGAVEHINLADGGNVDHPVKFCADNPRAGFFPGFPHRASGNGFAIFEKAAGQRPEAMAWRDGAAAKENTVTVGGQANRYNARVVVVYGGAGRAHMALPVVAGGYGKHQLPGTLTAKLHGGIFREINCLTVHRQQPENNILLDLIKDKLQHRHPLPVQPLGQEHLREAAVLMAITRSQDPEMVFIRRAEHLKSHQGQVAFPGGMWEVNDASLIETALRESEEEIALPRQHVELVAALEPTKTRFDVRVSPFVGFIPQGLIFVPELSELDAVFQVPMSYLLDEDNYGRKHIAVAGGIYDAPCVLYNEFCIWGFTFRVVLDFLAEALDFRPELHQEIVVVK